MASSDSPSQLRFSFPDVGVSAIAELDHLRAGRTVSGILDALPIEGDSFHGIYSGSEVACLISPEVWLPPENATTRVLPGEIGYYRQEGGQFYGFPENLAEICWFYDRDAVPSTPDGPVAVNVFGRFTDGWPEFASVCRQMRTSGVEPVVIELA